MEKEFVPYEIALKLKELGFNEKCYGYYTKNQEYFYFDVDDLSSAYTKNMDNLVVNSVDELECTAPLYQQAFKFVLGIIENNHKLDRIFTQRFFLVFTFEGFVMDDKELTTTYETDEETLQAIINFILNNR
jgi:hypothetical protein